MKKLGYKGINLPKGLKKDTFNFISGIIDTFEDEGKLNSLDSLSIYLLASNVDTYLECEKQLRKHGYTTVSDRGNINPNVYVGIQKQAMSAILSLLKELGLTLGSRSKIKVLDSADEDSPLMKFLKS